jgi:hypothetical protein
MTPARFGRPPPRRGRLTSTSSETEQLPGIAGQVYHDLIREQLHDAAATKDSLERRGFAVVTTSGAVLAVILGVATFAGQTVPTPASGLALAAIALIAFIAAIVCGLIVNYPLGYADVAAAELRRLADSDDLWTGPPIKALQRVAGVEVDAIESAHLANGRKALALRVGITFEAVAFIALGVAGVVILFAMR